MSAWWLAGVILGALILALGVVGWLDSRDNQSGTCDCDYHRKETF